LQHTNRIFFKNTIAILKMCVVLAWILWTTAGGATATTPAGHQASAERPVAASTEQTDLFPQALAQAIVRQADALNLLRKAVDRLSTDDDGLENQRLELAQLMKEMEATKADLEPLLTAIDREISQLSPTDETAANAIEAPELVQERARLNSLRARIVAAQKRTALSLLRAQKLEERIQDYHLKNFTTNILKRNDSPVSGQLWRNLDAALPRLWIQITTIADNWWATARLDAVSLVLTLIFSALCYTLLFLIRKRIVKSAMREPIEPPPGFLRQAMQASWFIPVTAMPGVATATAIFLMGDILHIWDGSIRIFAYSALSAFVIFSFVTALATGILQPYRPCWRLVEIPSPTALRLLWITNAITAVYAADLFLHHMIQLFHMPVEVRILETSLANGAFAALLAVFALTALPDEQDPVSAKLVKFSLNILRIPLLLAALAIIIATLAGYVALGRFIAGQIMLMGAGGIAVLLLHLAIRVVAATPAQLPMPFERIIGESSWLSTQRQQQIIDMIAFIANILLIGTAFALLLLSWGLPLSQLTDSLKALFFGFEIGQFRISLFKILIGAGLFIGVLFITRMAQGWMNRTVLNTPAMDQGIANSLHTGLGYVGVGIAAIIGISYAGVDLTQLTVVIGALSLGVGLGLQSIVNNFVSGLILLIERPVKVGDWVIVGNEQGYVRKISVRATEIETFDRASVIVPNSALISGTVQNWTHRSPMGRVVITVGVSYDADPQEVHDILLDVANSSDKVLGFPEPFVAFDDFGASSLDFSLRCYIADINYGLSTKTALRMEIFKRLKERGIEIPYPQQDIHLRDLDAIKSAMSRTQKQLSEEAETISQHNASEKEMTAPRARTDEPDKT